MGLKQGTKLGPYEIVSPLGAGGMGEVYRARDTKLNRDVALKVLPEAFAADPQRMARFEREAQVLASLNHSNIAAIYGLEESGQTRALVMELVEGQTLAERIGAPGAKSGSVGADLRVRPASGTTSGALTGAPLLESLAIAKQVAEALENAHDRGVVHRDLKPANVKITPEGTVKVLDFGLAKAMGPDEISRDASNSPTLSLAATQAGFILGTAAYMAPEQAKAKPVDRRADIWAFGVVLFEMLSGKKAFEGETVSDVLAAVIMKDPDFGALPETTPPSIQRLIRRCLSKDPKQRLQAIGEARITIEETLSGESGVGAIHELPLPEAAAPPQRRVLPWVLAGVLVGAVIAGFLFWKFAAPKPKPQHVVRFSVPAPQNTSFSPIFGSELSLSPDDREIAFRVQSGSGPWELWVRPLDSLIARRIPGTEDVGTSFWSPDGQSIAFFANNKLEKVALSGGAPQALCDDNGGGGGTWNRDGIILFNNNGALDSVPATGGTPALVLAPNKKNSGASYLFPQFLPDGKHFIFLLSGAGKHSIAVGSLGSKKITRLTEAGSNALYAPPGELLYLSANTLMERPFDAKSLRFTGAAVPIEDNVGATSGVLGFFSVSPSGVLAFQTSGASAQDQMTWFSRDGKELGKLGPPGLYECPAISRDGSKIAVSVGSLGAGDIWVFDLKRGTGSRLTFNPADDVNPVWSPDDKQILFSSNRKGSHDIYEKDSNGLGATQLVYASNQFKAIDDVSPDGRYAIYANGPLVGRLSVLPLGGGDKPFAFVQGKFHAANAQFSPNGRYLAYTTDETGRNEIYVQTFPQHTGKWQISTDGGVDPEWGHDGKELYFLDPKNRMMAAQVDTHSAAFQAGIPKPLFQAQIMPPAFWRSNFVVSPDGKRFLMLAPAGESNKSAITVVLNWTALLKNAK